MVEYKKPQQMEWTSLEREEKKAAVYNSRTRSSEAKAQEEYNKMNKTVKKSIKKDKLTYISGLEDEAEEAARKGNLK